MFFPFAHKIKRVWCAEKLDNVTIESYHRMVRKYTKTKAAFTSDNALLKLVFLAIQNMEKTWNKTAFNRYGEPLEIYFIRITD
jgi:putative transposase